MTVDNVKEFRILKSTFTHVPALGINVSRYLLELDRIKNFKPVIRPDIFLVLTVPYLGGIIRLDIKNGIVNGIVAQ